MADIFINYVRKDRQTAALLVQRLEARGYSVWWDAGLVPGQDFGRSIMEEIQSAKAIFTVWSAASVQSQWVMSELQYSLDRGIKLFGIRTEDVELPLGFRQYNVPLITDWSHGLDATLKALDVALGRILGVVPGNDSSSLEWDKLRDSFDTRKLESFVQCFPQSAYAELARERLASLGWERLRLSDDVQALKKFADEFPNTAPGEHARKRIQLITNIRHSSATQRQPGRSAPPQNLMRRLLSLIISSPQRHAPSPDVFISYRRDDSADITGRIFDRLVQRYTKVKIFKDVDSMPLGVDFRDYIKSVLDSCSVCLVVMGPNWLGSRDAQESRRIDEPRDYMRVEIESALENGIPVIPVFVSATSMPPEDELPESISALAFRHGMEVRRDPEFHTDVNRLISGIELYLNGRARSARPH